MAVARLGIAVFIYLGDIPVCIQPDAEVCQMGKETKSKVRTVFQVPVWEETIYDSLRFGILVINGWSRDDGGKQVG